MKGADNSVKDSGPIWPILDFVNPSFILVYNNINFDGCSAFTTTNWKNFMEIYIFLKQETRPICILLFIATKWSPKFTANFSTETMRMKIELQKILKCKFKGWWCFAHLLAISWNFLLKKNQTSKICLFLSKIFEFGKIYQIMIVKIS